MKNLSEETEIENPKQETIEDKPTPVKKSFSMSPALITLVLVILIALVAAVISYVKKNKNGN